MSAHIAAALTASDTVKGGKKSKSAKVEGGKSMHVARGTERENAHACYQTGRDRQSKRTEAERTSCCGAAAAAALWM